MKILLISDIHANIWALKAILEHEKCYDMLCCAGDYTDYGTSPAEVIDMMSEICGSKKYEYNTQASMQKKAILVYGNHDKHVINTWRPDGYDNVPNGQYKWVHYNCERLEERHIEWLKSLPRTINFYADGYNYCIQHQFDDGYGVPESRYEFNQFWEMQTGNRYKEKVPRRLIFGHSHRQMMCNLGDGMEWLNPGSISYRRPDDPDKSAHYIVIQDGIVNLRHVMYDRTKLYKTAKSFIDNPRMMRTEIQDFMFFFGDAKTSRDPLM